MTTPHRLFLCVYLTCRAQVRVCGRCDRGQIYCAGECALRARRQCMRKAGRRYQGSRAGRVKHARRARCYRARQKQKAASLLLTTVPPAAPSSSIVTHQGSLDPSVTALLPPSVSPPVLLTMSCQRAARTAQNASASCHFCGCAGTAWVRLGPLRRSPWVVSVDISVALPDLH